MTPLVLVVALSAFVHPHSSRDVQPAIVTRRVEPPPAAHPVREFVGRCVDPEVPAPTSELTEAVIIIGIFLLQALFCPCCRMVLAMPGKVASTVASTVLGRLRGGATDEALLRRVGRRRRVARRRRDRDDRRQRHAAAVEPGRRAGLRLPRALAAVRAVGGEAVVT